MRNKKLKYLAMAMAVALCVSMTGALANLAVVKSNTKVTVDGKAVVNDAYNINDNNYFKLRDLATSLDFGLTYDGTTNTAAIDRDGHYKPDAKQLITGNWAPATRARIQAVIDANADKGKYVVFDFDNTSVIFDIQEALLVYQIENLMFKVEPKNMEAVLETGIPDLTKSLGKNADGKEIIVSNLVADLVSDYTWLYDNYKGLKGTKDLSYIHATNQYQDFAAKLRFMYNTLGDVFDHAVSYPWVGYLFTGMTPAEVQELAAASHKYWASYGRYASETWTSPVELPGKAGVVSADFITGLTFTDELLDLYATLKANNIDVYIVSASPVDTVLAANKAMGYGVPEDRVFAMQNKLGADGRYLNEYNYDWGGKGLYAQTQGPGKSTIIKNFIAPKYNNVGPLMVFGDSAGDMYMMTDWMKDDGTGDTQLGVLFNRYRKPTSDKMTWEASVKAAEQMGKADAQFVLQGRDENNGQLRPTEYSILLGTDKEVLVRPAA
ncbi:MAG: haloacid dehalogenase-like hydrolase [Clostridia bacterium]|nr:haloacid dehalogenase-like hydrolase [Clostridia bacterium]